MLGDKFPILQNEHYGIDGGWEADILWVYNERVDEWEEKLPPEIRKSIGHGSLGNFPHYRTFFQNPPAVIDLSQKQVNLLSDLSCWNIVGNSNTFPCTFHLDTPLSETSASINLASAAPCLSVPHSARGDLWRKTCRL